MDFFHRAKKSLGQNFLKDKRYIRQVIDVANLKPDQTVIEIGPGKGALTGFLLESKAKVIAIEYDQSLVELLQRKFSNYIENGQLTLLHMDILKYLPDEKVGEYRIVANIPYHITGAILRHFLSADHQPQDMTLIMQKEVAERIVCRDGKQSILSLSVAAYGEPSYKGKIPAAAFSPKPKVDSAILHIADINRKKFINKTEETMFFKVVKQGFSQKRKKLLKNLRREFPKVDWESSPNITIPENIRAEDLKLNGWIVLARQVL